MSNPFGDYSKPFHSGPGSGPPPPSVGFVVPGPGSPSAPTLEELGPPPGYESTTYGGTVVSPPAYYFPPQFESTKNSFHIPKIPQDEVRSLLIAHVKSKWCWGSEAASELSIDEIDMSSSFSYHLDTFTERRETAWKFEPASMGEPCSPSYNGTPPGPWQVAVSPDHLFVNGSKTVPVPFTSIFRRCHGCQGVGKVDCQHCFGSGNGSCHYCSGTGTRTGETDRCLSCRGSGRTQCSPCNATGRKECPTCHSSGNLRYYVQLTVQWTSYNESFVADSHGLKDKHILKVNGLKVFSEEAIRIQPIGNFPDQRISQASKRIVNEHLTKHPMEKILRQKHCVKMVPVAVVKYTWRDRNGIFFVYGVENERQVRFENYPQRCCCGRCQIQ